jgi:hypothetical protein
MIIGVVISFTKIKYKDIFTKKKHKNTLESKRHNNNKACFLSYHNLINNNNFIEN